MATEIKATEAIMERIAEAIDFKNWILQQLEVINADPNKQVSNEYLIRRFQEVKLEIEQLRFKYFTAATFLETKKVERILYS